jgi:hypothetical protein
MLERASKLMAEAKQLRVEHEKLVKETEQTIKEIIRVRVKNERRFRK